MITNNQRRITPKKRGRPRKRVPQGRHARWERPLAFSVPHSAKILGLGKTKMYELLASNELASFCVGSRRLIAYSELVKFTEARSGG